MGILKWEGVVKYWIIDHTVAIRSEHNLKDLDLNLEDQTWELPAGSYLRR